MSRRPAPDAPDAPPAPAAARRALAPLAAHDRRPAAYAIKARVDDRPAKALAFAAQKTMYGGKHVRAGDAIFVFASENEGGAGLLACGVVTAADAVPRAPGPARQTPRVGVRIAVRALAERRLGRSELRRFSDWRDGRPETELNFKFYRQATDKLVGLSDAAAAFLRGFFGPAIERGRSR